MICPTLLIVVEFWSFGNMNELKDHGYSLLDTQVLSRSLKNLYPFNDRKYRREDLWLCKKIDKFIFIYG